MADTDVVIIDIPDAEWQELFPNSTFYEDFLPPVENKTESQNSKSVQKVQISKGVAVSKKRKCKRKTRRGWFQKKKTALLPAPQPQIQIKGEGIKNFQFFEVAFNGIPNTYKILDQTC